jgi:farnesyl-diphosphate farnesyltransferase
MTPHEYCKITLPKVSRTFAINIAILRGELYKAVLCSYLLCRILDTVEDTGFKNFNSKKTLFGSFKDMFIRRDFSEKAVEDWTDSFFKNAMLREEENEYYNLVKNTRSVIDNYLSLSEDSRNAVTSCIAEMSDGMLKMAVKKERQNGDIVFIRDLTELTEYCYYVAGTVGILSTRLFAEHCRYFRASNLPAMSKPAIALGLGLQMTNIIKDCWGDFQRGVCYLPQEMIEEQELQFNELFAQQNQKKTLTVINTLVKHASDHLYDALDYILGFPRSAFRIRLSCLWPLVLAIATLQEVKNNPALLEGQPVKISRVDVKRYLRKTSSMAWSNRALKNYFDGLRSSLE